MIDPASITPESYARLQTALVQSDVWAVMDRASGLSAIKKEQEELHRSAVDRYQDKEKWAQWGRLYGVGSVIIAHAQCFPRKSFWSNQANIYCSQFLNLVDANTGEVNLAVEGGTYTEGPDVAPDWKEIVQKLAEAYPVYFDRKPASERLELYKSSSGESAQRQREQFIENGNTR